MKKCSKCGCEFNDYEKICPGCGEKQNNVIDYYYLIYAVVGFFSPFLGIILYLILKNKNKKLSSLLLRGAIIGIIFQLLNSYIYLSI